jgi:hypothetical protein
MSQLLVVVMPYLVIKPELAQILVEMPRTLNYSSTGCRVPVEVRAAREAIFRRYQTERQEMRGR